MKFYKNSQNRQTISIRFYYGLVSAGFLSPADDYENIELDLNKYLIKHPSATFYVRVKGDSMENAGIFDGDLLIIDKAEKASQGSIILAVLDGEFTVKRFHKEANKYFLIPENPKYKPIEINENQDFKIWGVVIYVVHKP